MTKIGMAFSAGLLLIIPILLSFILLSYCLELFSWPFLFLIQMLFGAFLVEETATLLFIERGFSIFALSTLLLFLGIWGQSIVRYRKISIETWFRIHLPSLFSFISFWLNLVERCKSNIKIFSSPSLTPLVSSETFTTALKLNSMPEEIRAKLSTKEAYFIPTSPYFLNGFIFFIDPPIETSRSIDEVIDFYLSCGLLNDPS